MKKVRIKASEESFKLVMFRMLDIIHMTSDLHRFEQDEVIDRIISRHPEVERERLQHNVGEALLMGTVFDVFDHNIEEGTFTLTDKTFDVLKHFKVI